MHGRIRWVCQDNSLRNKEKTLREPTLTQLSARFASEELATDFKRTFEKCVDSAKSQSKCLILATSYAPRYFRSHEG